MFDMMNSSDQSVLDSGWPGGRRPFRLSSISSASPTAARSCHAIAAIAGRTEATPSPAGGRYDAL
jgi:hypothetical protein